MSQVGVINQAIRNAYEQLDTMPEPKPVNTGLLARSDKKEPEEKMNDAVRLLKMVREKTNGKHKAR